MKKIIALTLTLALTGSANAAFEDWFNEFEAGGPGYNQRTEENTCTFMELAQGFVGTMVDRWVQDVKRDLFGKGAEQMTNRMSPHTYACQHYVWMSRGSGVLGVGQLSSRQFHEWHREWAPSLFAAKPGQEEAFKTITDPSWNQPFRTCGVKNADGSTMGNLVLDKVNSFKGHKVSIQNFAGQEASFAATDGLIEDAGFLLSFSQGDTRFRCINFYRSTPFVQHLSCKVYKGGKEVGILGFLPKSKGFKAGATADAACLERTAAD